MEKLKPRILNYETIISSLERLTIVAPESEYGIKCAGIIFELLKSYVNVVLLINPDKSILYSAKGPVILIGNLADSKCMKELYYKNLAVTDLHYPGPGGYEIRTLLNPLGTGYNIIQIGYSDEAGLLKAVNMFCSEIKGSSLRYFCELHPTRLHIPEGKEKELLYCNFSLDDPTISHTAPIDEIGYLAYLTGKKDLLDLYYRSWKALFKIEYNHLKLHKRVAAWRFLEVTGMIPEDLRGEIVNFLYEWADGDEGIESIMHNIYQCPNFPRQNHGLIPAMGLVLLHDYFKKYYPELQKPSKWKEAADKVYSVYFNGSWKPLCDGLCHGWWLSQPAMLEYALFDDQHKYLESGGARKAAFCAMAVVNNSGWMPNAGDSSITRQFPGYVLDMTSEYYKDGKARYMSNLAPIWRRGYSGPISFLPKMYDVGIKPEQPKELIGVTVIPVDPIVYNAWRDYPDIADRVTDTPPTAPIEKCFDKLAIRTGFEYKDEFLLIDGLGGGSHSYADAMAILDYEKYGLSFVISEDQLYWIEPENHSMVTIYKNGKSDSIPSFAELEKIDRLSDGQIYISMILKNSNSADWRREIYLVPDKFLIINDTIIANKEGDYSIETHFRTPGYVELNGNCFYSRRKTRNGKDVDFLIKIICSHDMNCSVSEIPLHYSYRTLPGEDKPISSETDPYEYGKMRYNLDCDNLILSSCTGKTSLYMNRNDKVSFTSLLFATDESKRILMEDINGKLNVKIDNEVYTTKFSVYKSISNIKQNRRNSTLFIREIFKSDYDIKAYHFYNGKLWCGLKNGEIFNIDICNNEECAHVKKVACVNEEIHDIILHKGFIYIGSGTNSIIKLTENGSKVWNVKTTRIPTNFPWWEMDYPSAMSLKVVKYKGRESLVAGCGDDNARFYDFDGNLIDSYYFFAAVPNLINSFDVNSDGKNEILLAGNIITCLSHVDVLNDEGKLIHRFGGEGWTSIAKVVECFEINGKKAVALGVNHRNNFKLYEFDSNGEYCKGSYKINEKLAGAVSGIALNKDAGIIAAVTTQGFIAAYDVSGEQRWVNMINGIINDIEYFNGLFWVADTSGHVYSYDMKGNLINTADIKQKIMHLESINETLYIIADRKIYISR